MGSKEKIDGVGMFVAEAWVDSLVRGERHSERKNDGKVGLR